VPEFGGLAKRAIGLGARHQLRLVEVALVPGFVGFIDLVIRLGVILRRRFAQHRKLLRSLRDRHGARHGDLVVHIAGLGRERHLATGAS
jgi:hypothetical protein